MSMFVRWPEPMSVTPDRLHASVAVDDDLTGGRVAAGAVAAEVRRHSDPVVDAGTDLLGLRRVPLLRPVDRVADRGDAVADAGVAERPLGVGVPDLVDVRKAEGDRVHPDGVGGLVHGGLEGERAVRVGHAAVRARLVAVGHHVDGLEPEVRDDVEVLHVDPGAVRGAGPLRADVRDDLELAPLDLAVRVDAHLHLVADLVAVRPRDEVLVTGVVVLDRALRDLREDRGVDLGEVDTAAVAVPRAEVPGLDHAHLVLRDLEGLRQAGPRAVRVLVGVGDVELVAVPVHQRVRDLQGDVLLDGLVRDVLDDLVGLRVRRVTADEGCGDGDGRAVEGAGELLGRRGLHGLDHVEGGRKDLVLDVDRAHGLVADVLAGGGDDRDRRTDLEDLFTEEEARRLRGAEEDILVFLRQVPAAKDLDDAGHLLRGGRVDRLDLGVRVPAAKGAHEQHAVHPQVLVVRALVGDDAVALDAGDVRAEHTERTELRELGVGRALSTTGHLAAVLRDDGGDGLGLLADHLLPGRVLRELVPLSVGEARYVTLAPPISAAAVLTAW